MDRTGVPELSEMKSTHEMTMWDDERVIIDLEIKLEKIAAILGYRAAQSKKGTAMAMDWAIKAKIIHRYKLPGPKEEAT
jgi:hypothetical protein